jgi:hypothetical protein
LILIINKIKKKLYLKKEVEAFTEKNKPNLITYKNKANKANKIIEYLFYNNYNL